MITLRMDIVRTITRDRQISVDSLKLNSSLPSKSFELLSILDVNVTLRLVFKKTHMLDRIIGRMFFLIAPREMRNAEYHFFLEE